MKRHLPHFLTASIIILMLLHGPIVQPEDYHCFADTRALAILPNALDVLSNIGFALAGVWGWLSLRKSSATPGQAGHVLFVTALVLTAAGSTYYHLQPDDFRLLWDRIPIALACAGLLAGVHGDTSRTRHGTLHVLLLGILAIASVFWWQQSGDLRPYLLLQALPLVLIPAWQWIHGASGAERAGFGIAILLYATAKAAELHDHGVMAMTGVMSGHTLKHLLASAAAVAIVSVLARRAGTTT